MAILQLADRPKNELRERLWDRFQGHGFKRGGAPFRALSWRRLEGMELRSDLECHLLPTVAAGIDIAPLDRPGPFGGFLKGMWERELEAEHNPLCWLNGALHQSGLFLYVPPARQVEAPLHLVYRVRPGAVSSPRAHLVAGRGSRCQLVWHAEEACQGSYWINGVLDITVEEDAQVDLVVLADESADGWNTLAVRGAVKRGGLLRVWKAARGGTCGFDLSALLLGEGAQVVLKGLGWLTDGMQLHCRTTVEHRAPQCRSNQHFKAAIHAGRSHFEGCIRVESIAQETDAYQMSNALLLGEAASASHRPNLLIGADQVKATHGSTVGTLDEETLFYLRSRGLAQDAARRLAVRGFCHEIIDEVPWGKERMSSWLE